MNEELFNALLQQLSTLAAKLDKVADKDTAENLQQALEKNKNDDRLRDGEKRKLTKVAKVFAQEFETLLKPAEDKKNSKTEITLSKDSFKILKKTISSVIPEFGKIINDSLKKQKKEKTGGVLKFLGDVIGGAFGAIGSISKIVPFLLAAGGIALAFYIVKNIEKISKAIDIVLKSGKENLPTILESMAKYLFPFYKEFFDTAESFFKRILDSIDKAISQLPVLFDILLKNLPEIRATITGFSNDLIDISKKFSELSLAEKIYTIVGAIGAFFAAKVGITLLISTLGSLKGLAAGGAFLLIGEGLTSIASAAEKFGNMSWEGLGKAGAALLALNANIKFLSSQKPSWDIFLNLLGAGAVAGGLIYVLKELADAVKPWNEVTQNALAGAGIALGTLLGTLAVFAIPGTGEAAAIGSLFGSAGLLVAGGSIAVALRVLAEMFKETMPVWEKLPGIFKQFTEIDYMKLVGVSNAISALSVALAMSSISGGYQAVVNTFTNVWNKFTGNKNPVETIRTFETLDAEKLSSISVSIKRIFNSLDISKNLDLKKLNDTIEAAKKLTQFNEKGNILSIPAAGAPGTVAQDFISRPGMAPLRFSPQDTVVALKRPDLFGKDITESINRLTSDLRETNKKSLQALNEMSQKLSKLSELGNVNMINNSKSNTNITISPTTSKSFRDERYGY